MGRAPVERSGGTLEVRVWLVPGSKKPGIEGLHGDRLKVRVASPPEAGRANREAAKLLGQTLGCKVTLTTGTKSRSKTFTASGIEFDEALRRLGISSSNW